MNRVLLLKVVVTLLFACSGLLQFALTHWWRDRRTRKYRVGRRLVLGILVLSGAAVVILQFVDHRLIQAATENQEAKLNRLDRFVSGELAPAISVELYVGPNHPTPPSLTLDPEFPGFVFVKIANLSEYPMYELEVFLSSQKTNLVATKTAEKFNSERRYWPKFLPKQSEALVLPADIHSPWIAYDFHVRTQAGVTEHNFRFALLPTGWEFAKRVTGSPKTKPLSEEASERFPRTLSGEPIFSLLPPTNVQFATFVVAQTTNTISILGMVPADASERVILRNELGNTR